MRISQQKAIFKKAHKQARKTVKIVGDYQIAFSLALKAEYKKASQPKQSINLVTLLVVLPLLILCLIIGLGLIGLFTSILYHAIGFIAVIGGVACGYWLAAYLYEEEKKDVNKRYN